MGKRWGNQGRAFEDAVCNSFEAFGASFTRSGSVYVPYVLTASYTPDIVIGDMYIEVKSYLDEDDRRKMEAVKLSNPHLDIRFVFSKPFKLLPHRKKLTHAGWAEKNNFPWTTADNLQKWIAN